LGVDITRNAVREAFPVGNPASVPFKYPVLLKVTPGDENVATLAMFSVTLIPFPDLSLQVVTVPTGFVPSPFTSMPSSHNSKELVPSVLPIPPGPV